MTYKLIYIDDNANSKVLADGFNTSGKIKVEAIKPTSFEAQIKELTEMQDDFQGLILDLKLDEDLSGDRKAYYTATSLVSHIREKVNDGDWKNEVPIFLFTTQDRLNSFFSSGENTNNLFDLCFAKDKIKDESIQHKIFDVIESYSFIGKNKSDLAKVFDIESIDRIDQRILSVNTSSIYSFSKLILKQLVLSPGPLINELYLAARLGIDIGKSSDWKDLKDEILITAKYSGAFSKAWERWWMYKINDLWDEISPSNLLASMDARERVDLLKEKLGLKNLEPAHPLPKGASYRYWTVCQGYHAPLDPREGLRIDEPEPLPWQENKYISIEAALERLGRDEGLKIHPSERDRFEDIKEKISYK